MTFTMLKTDWDALVPWKLRALRYVMGDLLLGEPAEVEDADGTMLVAFNDERFTADGALALRLVLAGIGALPDDPGQDATPESVLADAGAEVGGAAFIPPWEVGVAYAVDARVLYDGAVWRCLQGHTSQSDWAPDLAPALWSHPGPAGGVTEWATATPYAVGDHVTYQGTEYVCLQAHTSQAGWHPDAVPALWQPQ